MKQKLGDEIKQTRPFESLEQEAFLNVVRTAAVIQHEIGELIKSFGITPTQFNVLRILRGAGDKGLGRNEVRDRLIAQVPDATRLLDRMAELGLVVRSRDEADKRCVGTRITRRGLQLLEKIDAPLADAHVRQLAHMSQQELTTLIALLEKMRDKGSRQR